MISPCKVCADRRIGCHAKCEQYKEWREMFDREAERRQRAQEAIDFMDKAALRGLRKYKYSKKK